MTSSIISRGERLTLTYASHGGGDLKVDVYPFSTSPPVTSRASSFPPPSPFILYLDSSPTNPFFSASRRAVPPWLLEICCRRGWPLVSADYRLAPDATLSDTWRDIEALWAFLGDKDAGSSRQSGGPPHGLHSESSSSPSSSPGGINWSIASAGPGSEADSGNVTLSDGFARLQQRGGLDVSMACVVASGGAAYLAAVGGALLGPAPISLTLLDPILDPAFPPRPPRALHPASASPSPYWWSHYKRGERASQRACEPDRFRTAVASGRLSKILRPPFFLVEAENDAPTQKARPRKEWRTSVPFLFADASRRRQQQQQDPYSYPPTMMILSCSPRERERARSSPEHFLRTLRKHHPAAAAWDALLGRQDSKKQRYAAAEGLDLVSPFTARGTQMDSAPTGKDVFDPLRHLQSCYYGRVAETASIQASASVSLDADATTLTKIEAFLAVRIAEAEAAATRAQSGRRQGEKTPQVTQENIRSDPRDRRRDAKL